MQIYSKIMRPPFGCNNNTHENINIVLQMVTTSEVYFTEYKNLIKKK